MHLIFVEINATDAKMVVASAETCCEEDVYHFDDVDRFFMVSCLALWWVILPLRFRICIAANFMIDIEVGIFQFYKWV